MKRKRRKHNKLHQHRKDEIVQTGPTEIDPQSWSGNQRVLNFGPTAQRDPFFYYYPKGWDILYPAHFGFFPYRTTKFRGSSPIICLSAFGLFFLLGGCFMTYFGYFILYDAPFWKWPTNRANSASSAIPIPPIQVAGPAFLAVGVSLVLLGVCWWLTTLNLFSESLRHTQLHQAPPGRTIRFHYRKDPPAIRQPPYQPLPPPAYPILANAYTEPTIYSPQAELKLYPPVMHGYSMLSLLGRSKYCGSAYNTLQMPTANRYHPSIDQTSLTDEMEYRVANKFSDSSRKRSDTSRRTKSVASRGSRHRSRNDA